MPKITLKAARVNVDLTQKEAAKKIGVSNKTLANWEAGKSFPTVDMILIICGVYNCEYDDLIFLSNNPL